MPGKPITKCYVFIGLSGNQPSLSNRAETQHDAGAREGAGPTGRAAPLVVHGGRADLLVRPHWPRLQPQSWLEAHAVGWQEPRHRLQLPAVVPGLRLHN